MLIPQNESKWVSPTFIIPKRTDKFVGSVTFISFESKQDTNSLLNLILVCNTTPLSSMLRVKTSARLLHHLENTNMQGSRWDFKALLILHEPQWKTS
ncbi:hypothetical protein ACHAW6_006631 [Cyclotella cf. meneghiniana]